MKRYRRIAGHDFEDGPQGTACAVCGKTWLSILDRRDQWVVGAKGIAHVDSLNSTEVAQLNKEIDRIWDALTGKTPVPEPEDVDIYSGYGI